MADVIEIRDENFTFKYSTTEDKAFVGDKDVGTLRESAYQVPGKLLSESPES